MSDKDDTAVDPEHVTFDRNEIRKKINKLSFIEARRLKIPIYDALVQELNEDNCIYSAHHFKCLAEKEKKLFELTTIGHQLKDNPTLLFAIFENMKLIEKLFADSKECGKQQEAFELLYETVLLFEPHIEYNWLLSDVYKIVAGICEHFQGVDITTNKVIARIYYKYGVYLLSKDEELALATKYLERSLHLCRGQLWVVETNADWGVFETLHQNVCHVLFMAFMAHAEEVGRYNPNLAAEICQKAAWTIAEVSVTKNKLDYTRAKLAYADFKIEVDDFTEALTVLAKIRSDIASKCEEEEEFQKISAKVYLSQGVCYIGLEDHQSAYRHLNTALEITQKYDDLKGTEAQVQLTLGKLFSKDRLTEKAQKAYVASKNIFIFLGDIKNTMKLTYLLAKLQTDKIFPYFMDLIKNSETSFCSYYNLRQWKNRCTPFWIDMCEDTQNEERDPLYCLLNRAKPS